MSRKSKLGAMFDAIDTARSDELLPSDESQIPEAKSSSEDIQHITLSRIYVNPDQFRKYFDPDEQEKLKNAIQQNGFQGAILLRPIPSTLRVKGDDSFDYELVYGESRYHAVKDLGHNKIPSIIRNLTDTQARRIRLDENLIRKDLNPLEEVEGLLEIAADELRVSPEEITSLLDEVDNAAKRNKNLTGDIARQSEHLQAVLDYYKKGTLSGFRTKLRKLRRLPEDIKEAIQGKLDWTKAIEIAPIKDAPTRKKLLQWAIKEKPSVAQIRQRRKELVVPVDREKKQIEREHSIRNRFYKGLEKISSSEEWLKPENHRRIEELIQEIEDIFNIKIS